MHSFQPKEEMKPSVRMLADLGYTLYGSKGTAIFYEQNGIPVSLINYSGYKILFYIYLICTYK
jgi:hypothetical protein